jgi:hypothetical protein
MFRRILRSTIVLTALIGAYQAYVLFAVPRMEPPLAVRQQRIADRDELDRAAKSVTKYQLLLSNYFPKDHWSQVRAPKVFADGTERAMLVIDDYTRHQPSGDANDRSTQVDINQMALLIFPTPPHEGVAAPRDAIVIEANQGAHLLFDDFHPELGRIGQITRGEFPGPIIIRSDMREPGPDDDLLVETSDVQMNTKLLYTASPVRFRMGQNVGGGRELEIRFLADEHVQPRDSGLRIAGFDTLEIRREVRMRMQLNTASLLPGGSSGSAASPGSHAERGYPASSRFGGTTGPVLSDATQSVTQDRSNAERRIDAKRKSEKEVPKPPVDVTCNGPFTFDFVRYVASVDRDVEVRQLNPEGPSDQLNCNQLDIRFAPRILPDAKPEPVVVDPGKRQQRDLSRLEAVGIIALGHPAVAVSPTKKVEARGDRIQIAIREQHLLIDGGSESILINGENRLSAPLIEYQDPGPDASTKIGRFRATGPGSLHFVPEADKPDQVFQAAWQTSVQLDREKGQPIIVMEGRPELAFAAAGSIIGDRIWLYLRELAGKAPSAVPSVKSSDKPAQKQFNLAPDRLIATGRVGIRSQQLTGQTQQLVANFRMQEPTPDEANKDKTSPPGPTNRTAGNEPQQSYQIDADKMRLDVFMRGQKAVPASLACDGHIVLREMPLVGTNQQPLEVRGEQLFVDQLETKTPHIILKGNRAFHGSDTGFNATSTDNSQLAQLSGRGVSLFTDVVEMDGRENHLWSDGPGNATLQMTRDLRGNASAVPTPVNIHWQGGLRFDGRTITFDREVLVSNEDSKLHCDRMLATLAAPIQFGQHNEQSATSVRQIDFEGRPILIENVSRDTGGVSSHDRMQLNKLSINQQTGAIRGEGPGTIRSTRFGNGVGPLGGQPPAPAATSLPPGTSGNKLHFLRVDFHAGLDGNMYTREITFHERVRSVYGPVDSWEQELDLNRPESLPPDSMTMTCDDLRLNEDPLSVRRSAKSNTAGGNPMGPVQLQAKGNVRIDGQSPKQGEYSIQAVRASYEPAPKDLFILEGDARTPAKLWRRTPTGAMGPPLEARKIYYMRSTNDVKVGEIQYLEINQGDVKLPRPNPAAPRAK